MRHFLVIAGAWLFAVAAPSLAQKESQPAIGTATQPAKTDRPDAAGSVQVDVVPLIRSFIRHAVRPKPGAAVQAPEQVPQMPVAAAVAVPPEPTIAAPSAVSEPPAAVPQPPVRTAASTQRPPSSAVAPSPPDRRLPAAKGGIVHVTNQAELAPPLVADRPSPKDSATLVLTSADPVANAVEPNRGDPPLQRYRLWPIAIMLSLLALAIAAALGAIHHRRLVRRTRSMLKIEPKLDLSRSQCQASGLAFAGGSDV